MRFRLRFGSACVQEVTTTRPDFSGCPSKYAFTTDQQGPLTTTWPPLRRHQHGGRAVGTAGGGGGTEGGGAHPHSASHLNACVSASPVVTYSARPYMPPTYRTLMKPTPIPIFRVNVTPRASVAWCSSDCPHHTQARTNAHKVRERGREWGTQTQRGRGQGHAPESEGRTGSRASSWWAGQHLICCRLREYGKPRA